MQIIKVTWALPTTRTDGSALAPTDILSVKVTDVFAGVDTSLPGTATEFDTGDVTGQFGSHVFAVTALTAEGGTTENTSVLVPTPVLAPASGVTGLSGTLITS